MTDINTANDTIRYESTRPLSVVLVMVCIYIFLFIERPWESVSYLHEIPIERTFAIAMIIAAFLNGRFKTVSSPTNKWVYGLLALHFIMAPFAFSTEYAVDQGVEYAKMVVLYLLMLAVADDEATLKILIKAYVFSMMFYVLHSLWEYHNGRHFWAMGISRMMGVDSKFNDPNAFGASVVLSIPFAYALLRTETRAILRKLYYGYFALVALCVVLTGSRTSSVALLFIMILWGATQQGKRKIFALSVTVLAIAVIWSAAPEEKRERIRTLWDAEAGPANAHQSAKGRLDGWNVSWKMFKREPFSGVGAGGNNFIGYRMANRIDEEGHESPTQSHVLYGEVLAELGILGAIFFTGLVMSIGTTAARVRFFMDKEISKTGFSNYISGAIIASLLLLLLFGFGGHNFYRPLWLWLAAWAGVLHNLAARHRSVVYKGEAVS